MTEGTRGGAIPRGRGDIAVPGDSLRNELLARLQRRLPALDLEVVQTGVAIVEFAVRALAAVETHFGRYGLSQSRYSVLVFLYHFPERDWTPALLAEATRVRRPTMTGIVQVLERSGWVRRQADRADRRKTVLVLTAAGRRRFDALLPRHFDRFSAAFAAVGRGRSAALRHALQEMRALVRRWGPSTSGRGWPGLA